MPRQTETPGLRRSRRVRRNNMIILILMVIALAALFGSMISRNPNFISGKTVRYECPPGYLKANGHPFWEGAPVCVPGMPATRIEE